MQQATTTRLRLFNLFMAGTILLALGSCKKDKSNDPEPGPGSSKIKEYKNGDEFIRFTYNPNGTIKKATVKSELNTGSDEVDFTVTYDAQNKIDEVVTSAGERIVPLYENGVMIRASVFDAVARQRFTNYFYENNALKVATIYVNTGADFTALMEFRFTYNANGNLSETIVLLATGVPGQMVRAGHVTCQFDEKVNPLYEHRDFLALLWQAASKNNIIREDHFDANLTLEDIYNYVYTYKANGLPEKAVVTSGLPGQPPVTTALNFIY